jgi:hypothetical protein
MPSNREKFRGPRINKSAWEVTSASEAKKRLIATFTKLEIKLTHSQHKTSPFSNRNKKRVYEMDLFHESRITDHESLVGSIPVECPARAAQSAQAMQFEGDIPEN